MEVKNSLLMSLGAWAMVLLLGELNLSFAQTGKEDWLYRTSPAIWFIQTNGSSGLEGVEHDVDDETAAGTLTFEAEKGRITVAADLAAADLSDSTAAGRLKFDATQFSWTQTIGYDLLAGEKASLDAVAGMRLTFVSEKLKIRASNQDSGADGEDVSADETWVDPVLGARGRLKLSDEISIRAAGDVGGFGMNSTLTWQALGALTFDFASWASAAAGYRALGYDHDRSGLKYDLTLHGPFIGAEFRF